MARFIIKRVFYMILVLWIVTTITFFLVHSIPGRPCQRHGTGFAGGNQRALSGTIWL